MPNVEVSEGRRLPAASGVRGVTDTTIRIGMITSDASAKAAAFQAIGGNDAEGYFVDFEKSNAAAVDAVNAVGGIAGRKVELVEYFYSEAGFSSPTARRQENQRACAHWTEDNEVFAFQGVNADEVTVQCAANTKTPMVATGFFDPFSQQRFETMSEYWYSPSNWVADRRERGLARFLIEHGFFNAGAKVGLLVMDNPEARAAVERGMKPVLAAHGVTPAVEIFYPHRIESPWANYVLQLQMAEVTHVVFGAGPPGAELFMMRAAEDQRYRPRWGLGSDQRPNGLITLQTSPEQLANVSGMGWHPIYDTGDSTPQSVNSRVCDEWLGRHGVEDTRYGREHGCDLLFFLTAAFEQADEVSPAGLARGVARLERSYPSTMLIDGTTRFGVGRHGGVAKVRRVAYERNENRFRYVTPVEPVTDE